MPLLAAVKNLLGREAEPSAPDRPEKYLFIICMNNSGSTLLERVVRQCRNAIAFPATPDAQTNGQQFAREFMPIPGRMKPKCRRIWSEQAEVLENAASYDWRMIKRRWRMRWALNPKFLTAETRVFLEKSPPNVFRASMLQAQFSNTYFVLMHRNPYAVVEGIRRRARIPLGRGIRHWIRCSRKQMENEGVLRETLKVSYEDLSENPKASSARIIQFVPELDDLDIRREVAVQAVDGKIRQPIVNYNAKQIELLSKEDLAEINAELDRAPEVMTHFGYDYVR